jgi:hypothetical protein
VGHLGLEIQAVAREIDDLSDILDFGEPGVERAYVHGEG